MHRLMRILACSSLAASLAACSSLLPRGSSVTLSPFASYEEAKAAFDRIEPYQTPVAKLAELGFDPAATANVTVIPYPEVVARLAPHPGVPLDALDRGVRDCLLAQTACRAYVYRFSQQSRKREGEFLSDFFNFRRITHIEGWRFEAMVVARDGLVLFKNAGGEPRIDLTERQVNPLGPFQSGGEAAAGLIKR
jgi:hypothetical protein